MSFGLSHERASRMTLNELRMYVDARSDMLAEPEKGKVRDATQADIRAFARS